MAEFKEQLTDVTVERLAKIYAQALLNPTQSRSAIEFHFYMITYLTIRAWAPHRQYWSALFSHSFQQGRFLSMALPLGFVVSLVKDFRMVEAKM